MSNRLNLLQKHFDTVLESPDSIKKLRELILTLARQGKLVKQDPNDQPASELLKEIQAEKTRLIKEGKIKKQKELPPIKPEEVPYEVPKGWRWTRLGTANHINMGQSPDGKSYNEIGNGVPLVNGPAEFGGKNPFDLTVATKFTTSPTKMCEKGDLLLCVRGSTTGRTNIAGFDSCIGRGVASLKPYIYSQFLNQFILSLREKWSEISTGSTFPNISQEKIQNYLLPLPPLAEQKRIVAKIDELMALCDKLELQHKARNEKRLAVHTSAMNRLLTASDKKEFDVSWQFITHYFDSLYSVKENVAELKKVILTLAMQGRLVKQDPNDQPASELLKEIQAEKERLIKEGKIKKQKELQPIKPEEVPYEVPKGWEWVRLGAIGEINPRNSFDDGQDAGFVPMPKIFAEYGLKHSFEVKKWSEIKKGYTHFADGDIGLAKITPCFENGKSCVFDGLPNKIGAGTTELHIFRNTYSAIFPNYLLLYIKNPRYIFDGQRKMTGSAGQKRVPLDYFSNNPFPLPPLAEQKRIVAQIDELMALCGKLENQIEQAKAKQTALFDAVLAKV